MHHTLVYLPTILFTHSLTRSRSLHFSSSLLFFFCCCCCFFLLSFVNSFLWASCLFTAKLQVPHKMQPFPQQPGYHGRGGGYGHMYDPAFAQPSYNPQQMPGFAPGYYQQYPAQPYMQPGYDPYAVQQMQTAQMLGYPGAAGPIPYGRGAGYVDRGKFPGSRGGRPAFEPAQRDGVQFTRRKRPFVGGSLETQRQWERVTTCCFFLQGDCKFGDGCRFVHEDDGVRPCQFGSQCRVGHASRVTGEKSPENEAAAPATEKPSAPAAEKASAPAEAKEEKPDATEESKKPASEKK